MVGGRVFDGFVAAVSPLSLCSVVSIMARCQLIKPEVGAVNVKLLMSDTAFKLRSPATLRAI